MPITLLAQCADGPRREKPFFHVTWPLMPFRWVFHATYSVDTTWPNPKIKRCEQSINLSGLDIFSSIMTWADQMSRFSEEAHSSWRNVDRKEKKLLLLCKWSVSAIHLGEEPISTSSTTIPKQDRNFSGCHLEASKREFLTLGVLQKDLFLVS